MNIKFDSRSVDDILNIKDHLEKEKKGRVKLSPSDAARWAVAEQAQIIKQNSKGGKK